MEDGPKCYQISSIEQYSKSPEVKDALDNYGNKIDIDELSEYMSNVVESFSQKHKNELQEFSFSQTILMNLLLTFESYDEATRLNDIYMPEEKVVNFKTGYIKLSFLGKLRLRNLNEKNPNDKKEIEPQLTFGVIEGKELIIKSHQPFTFNYVYIRLPEGVKEKTKISIAGYSNNDIEIYRIIETIVPKGRKWIKVLGKETVTIDYIKLPGEIEIDNLSVTELNKSNDVSVHSYFQKELDKAINDFIKKKEANRNDGDHIIYIDDL